jgi:hypothetical protein
VLKELEKMDVFFKEDICDYELLHHLIYGMRDGDGKYLVEKRFEFLVNWDPPYELLRRNISGHLPLHHAAHNMHADQHQDIFRKVFETGMQYFPKKRGILLLFTERNYNNGGETPLDETVSRRKQELYRIEPEESSNIRRENKREILSMVIDAILICNAAVPIDTEQTATDKLNDFDCVYFLLRREPDEIIISTVTGRETRDIRISTTTNGGSRSGTLSERKTAQRVNGKI